MDVELPLEVDDEYLAERKQPEGKPSQLSYFVSAIKLVQIAGLILRTIVRTSSVARLQEADRNHSMLVVNPRQCMAFMVRNGLSEPSLTSIRSSTVG